MKPFILLLSTEGPGTRSDLYIGTFTDLGKAQEWVKRNSSKKDLEWSADRVGSIRANSYCLYGQGLVSMIEAVMSPKEKYVIIEPLLDPA